MITRATMPRKSSLKKKAKESTASISLKMASAGVTCTTKMDVAAAMMPKMLSTARAALRWTNKSSRMTAIAVPPKINSGAKYPRFKTYSFLSTKQTGDGRNAQLNHIGQNGRVNADQHNQRHEGEHIDPLQSIGVFNFVIFFTHRAVEGALNQP